MSWWMWLLIGALIALIGLLVFLRMQQKEDE
jgi:hypothetical protein